MTCCGAQTAGTAAIAQCDSVEQKLRSDELLAASHPLEGDMVQTDFVVPEMHCAACIAKIERAVSRLPHVETARANLSTRRVRAIWNRKRGDGLTIAETLEDIGFKNTVFAGEDQLEDNLARRGKSLLLALAVAGFAAANIMLLSVSVWSGADAETAKLFHLISGLIAVPTVAYSGRPFFASAFSALSARRLNMDVPISLAVLLALGMGLYESLTGGHEAYFDACVTLLFFLLVGRYLDHLMRQRAQGAVQSLARITSRGGLEICADGSTQYVASKDIAPGMKLRVLPGERFPVDCQVLKGKTDLDRSLVTGESESVFAQEDANIEAGVLNITGPVDVVATSDAKNSFMAEIMRMMEAAETGRGRYVRIAERMASIYAPAVHLLALITFLAWMVISGGEWRASMVAAIAVLIITCPCALGLAVPVVHVVGATRLFKNGILMRDGSAFERLSEVDTIVFDKTGTLTEGTAAAEVLTPPPASQQTLLATMAAHSSHPASKSLNALFRSKTPVSLQDVTEYPGFGIEGFHDGRRMRLGRPNWVAEIAKGAVKDMAKASVAFAIEAQPAATFALRDTYRSDAKQAINALVDAGLEVQILSGDREAAVERCAKQLNILRYQSGLTPAGKIGHLQTLMAEGHTVMMVGDGLNDAPALVAAHVSMAPATASEAGRLASDFVFTRDRLEAVPFVHTIARRTNALIRQNFAIAIAYNCIAVPMAMAGYVTPLIAAIAMSASSIVVVANSLRLNGGSRTLSELQMSASLEPGEQQQTLYNPPREALA